MQLESATISMHQNKDRLIPVEKLLWNIQESFAFIDKLEYCRNSKKLILWEMGSIGQIYDQNSNVVGETKILVDDYLDYLNTPFSKDVKRGISRFFKIWAVDVKNKKQQKNSASLSRKNGTLQPSSSSVVKNELANSTSGMDLEKEEANGGKRNQIGLKFDSNHCNLFTKFSDVFYCCKYFGQISEPNLVENIFEEQSGPINMHTGVGTIQNGGGLKTQFETEQNGFLKSSIGKGRLFKFDFTKGRDLINSDPENKSEVAKLIFQDLYTAFYYVMYFWYLFILTLLKQPSQLAIDKETFESKFRLGNLLFTNFNTIKLFYLRASNSRVSIKQTFPKVYMKHGLAFPKLLAAFRDMGNQLQLVKNQFNYVLGKDEFEVQMTYLIWSCLGNNKDFSMYRSKFRKKFIELIGYFFNVDWNNKMPIHEHPFFNFMFLAQVFIPDTCQLRKSLDSAVAEFTRKWITSMAPKYLTDKNERKALKLDRIKKLMSNKEYRHLQKHSYEYNRSIEATINGDFIRFPTTKLASKSVKKSTRKNQLGQLQYKQRRKNETTLKEIERTKEFKDFHKLLLNVKTIDPDIGHLLMVMDQILHSETTKLQILQIQEF